ncbi:MAG: hypothetical protein HY996_05025 [Micrococcales bacterium]|nr:hypothetical protein [Micrococcales bacterium]
MTTWTTRRLRRRAHAILAYRAWAADPSNAAIPCITVLSDPVIHRFERARELRLAQNGRFETRPAVGIASRATA